MKNVTKISIAVIGVALIGVTYWIFQNPEAPTLDSLRVQAQESREREIQAQKDREAREDTLSQALHDQCYSQSLTLTGVRYAEKQKKSYQCWKDELTKINNSWTVASAISEAPPKWITPTTASPATKESIKKAQSPTKPVQNVKKIELKQSSEKSKYWTAYEMAVNQIRKWEGLRLSSYWDYSHCSVGYGFSYPCGKKITAKQADLMLADMVKEKLPIVQKQFPNLSPEKQGVLVSFAHNCPAGYADIVRRGLSKHSLWCKTAGGKILQWLVNRRAEESKILFSK